MEQGVIDSAIDEWRRRIQAYVWAKWDISSKRCENINNLLNSNVSTCISLKLCKMCVILKSWICGSCGFFQTSWSKYVMRLFLHSIPFPAVKEFWKSAEIWQSYCQSSAAPFFETQCIFMLEVYNSIWNRRSKQACSIKQCMGWRTKIRNGTKWGEHE